MLLKNIRKFKVFWAIFLLFISFSFSQEIYGKISPANNYEYYQKVLPLLKNAKNSIYMIMYIAKYYKEYPNSETNHLLQELINAKKRGLKVEVILERPRETKGKIPSEFADESLKKDNENTAKILTENGVSVYFDSPYKTTHSKILIIDEKYVVIGSANWTYYGLTKNNETSLIIESPEIAKIYMEYFENIKKKSSLYNLIK